MRVDGSLRAMTVRRSLVACLLTAIFALATIQFWIPAFIYRPTALKTIDPRAWDLRNAVAMRVSYPNGTAMTGWWHPPADSGNPVILIVHGRSANIASRAQIMRRLIADGMGVLMFDYRGYGASPGHPTERLLDQDTLEAYRWLRRRGVPAKQIVVVGQSLGNGPAAFLAAQEPIGALLLVSPFTNLPQALGERLPWLPVQLVDWGRNRFDVASELRHFNGPALLIASGADGFVPIENVRKLKSEVPRSQWLDASPLKHDGMLDALARDGRLTHAVRNLISPSTAPSTR